MKTKKALAAALAAALAVSMAACSGGTSSTAGTASSGAASAENGGSSETVSLTIWSPTGEAAIEDWWVETLDAWNAEHPDVQVSREAIDRSSSYDYENKITAATTSNSLPDILFVDGPTVSYYAANGIIVPIDGAYTEEDKEDFMPSSIQQNTYDGHMYAIGPTESSVILYYNKDHLDAAGIEYPSDTDISGAWTWSEFYENAGKLTTDDYVGTNLIMDKGEGIIYGLSSFWNEADAPLISEDGTTAEGYVNSDASIEVANYINQFFQNGYANTDPVTDEFLTGHSATMLSGTWNIQRLEQSDLNWGVSYFPVSDDGKAVSPTGDWSAGVSKNCQNVETAEEFLQWLMNTDNVASYAAACSTPASRTSAYEKMEGWDEGARALVRWQLENTGVARPRSPSYSVLSSEFASAMLNIFSGADTKSELDNVAAEFDDDYQTYYAE